jgi:3-oxoacyl-[acyl-carrier protein] reductase
MKNLQNSLYQDRIVLITGTTKGIGLHLAKHFLEQEAIVCGFARSESSLQHNQYYHYRGDVTNINDVKGVIQEIRKKFDHLDILINNAGIASMNPSMLMPETTAKEILDINIIGVFNMSRESTKLLFLCTLKEKQFTHLVRQLLKNFLRFLREKLPDLALQLTSLDLHQL